MEDEVLALALAAGKAGLVEFRAAILDNDPDYEVEPAPFHYAWSDILLKEKPSFAVEGFRESAKTQIVLRAFLLYSLLYPSKERDYIVVIKNNATQASKILKNVQEEFLSNPICEQALVSVRTQSADLFSVDVRDETGEPHNVLIEAYGKGASIRGLSSRDRRPKIIILDDPQDAEDCSPTSQVHQKDWEWFNADVCFLGKNSRVFIIANNLGERSIIERIIANSDQMGFKVMRVPQYDEATMTPAWPARDKIEDILKEKESFRGRGELAVWLREKMCIAVADELRVFKREDFRYWGRYMDGHKLRPKLNCVLLVDPAASIKEAADYRACVLPGVDQDGNWFVLDISFGRYDTAVLIEEIFRLVVLWKVRDVAIEEGVLKASLEPFMREEMKKRQVFFNIIPLKAKAKKEERIKLMQPRFSAHTIFLPEDAPWLSELESELLAFTMEGTKGLHDDLIDALAYFEQVARRPMGKAESKDLPRNYLTYK